MAHTRRTLALDRKSWDLTSDASGAISLVRDEGATAQNLSNETRLFTNDAYFIQDAGVPHFILELGLRVSDVTALKSHIRAAAARVPDILEIIDLTIDSFDPETRLLSGEVIFTTVEGERNVTIATYI